MSANPVARPNVNVIDHDGDVADEIFGRYLKQLRVVKRRRPLLVEALRRMPWWAQPGPCTLLSDGRVVGSMTWSPAITEFTLPRSPVQQVIRPAEMDYRRRWLDSPFGTPEQRQRQYEACIVKLEERRRAQTEEMKIAGADVAREQSLAAWSEACRISLGIDRLRPSPIRLAAKALMKIGREAHGPTCLSKQWEVQNTLTMNDLAHTLRDLVPVLPPLLRKTAIRVLKPGGGPVEGMAIWAGGYELSGCRDMGRPPPELLVRKPEAA